MARKSTLTAATVNRIKPPAQGQRDHFDSVMPGFALRVSAKGARSYVFFYRPKAGPRKGKLRRLTIGSTGEYELKDARAKARQSSSE